MILLSNNKVLRYEYNSDQIAELESLEHIEVFEIKVLETGENEKYVFLTEDSVVVCTLLTQSKTTK